MRVQVQGGVRLSSNVKQAKPVEHEVPIKVVYLGNALILRQRLGEGTLGDKKVSLSLAVSQPVGSLLAECDGKIVAIDVESFITAACKIIEDESVVTTP